MSSGAGISKADFSQLKPVDPLLAEVYRDWYQGKAGVKSMRAVSLDTGLDCLEDYRWRPLPTPPAAVKDFREAEASLTQKDIEKFMKKWGWWFDQESKTAAQNISNRLWLKQLWAWAWVKGRRGKIEQIRELLARHEGKPGKPVYV